jgi:hypothetical protein
MNTKCYQFLLLNVLCLLLMSCSGQSDASTTHAVALTTTAAKASTSSSTHSIAASTSTAKATTTSSAHAAVTSSSTAKVASAAAAASSTTGKNPGTCATTACGTSACCEDQVTGPQCIYQPTLYTCADGVRLCPYGDAECNLTCYNSSIYYCNNGVVTQIPVSPTTTGGSSTTGKNAGTCATTNCGTSACCEDQVTGPQCIYQPTMYSCVDGVRLCQTGFSECNLTCYNSSLYYCDNGAVTQIPPPASTTGGSTTGKNPGTCASTNCGGYACCEDQVTGPQCIYQPTLYTCADGVRLCPYGDAECDLSCYNPNLYTCTNGVVTQIPTAATTTAKATSTAAKISSSSSTHTLAASTSTVKATSASSTHNAATSSSSAKAATASGTTGAGK